MISSLLCDEHFIFSQIRCLTHPTLHTYQHILTNTPFYTNVHLPTLLYPQMAMWNLLGERPIDACHWESFGKGWMEDTIYHLDLPNIREFTAEYGRLPDLTQTNADHDILFCYNGTTSGVCVPNLDWISDYRQVCTCPVNANTPY